VLFLTGYTGRAPAADPLPQKTLCFIHGTMADKIPEPTVDVDAPKAGDGPKAPPKAKPEAVPDEPKPGNFSNLNRSVRLRWETRDAKACRAIAREYCKQRSDDKFVPRDLSVHFRPAKAEKPTDYWKIHPDCRVEIQVTAAKGAA
jgi:hypothetical protein